MTKQVILYLTFLNIELKQEYLENIRLAEIQKQQNKISKYCVTILFKHFSNTVIKNWLNNIKKSNNFLVN